MSRKMTSMRSDLKQAQDSPRPSWCVVPALGALKKNERCIDYLMSLRSMDGSDLIGLRIPCFGASLAFKKDMEAKEKDIQNDT